ncbi:MAG: class I SAM-dependent methyltransferase [Bacteroidales bacterium]|nr:MAG: class I SAM-dependent methyltransferase [Bacteroidales bacterium]
MIKPRIVETDNGIQDEGIAVEYDRMMRKDRDNGILYANDIIKYGINGGSVLEIGQGPGYLGLEWLAKTQNTNLTGIDISDCMVRIAEKNAEEYGFLTKRVKYIKCDAHELPFDNESFDNVFSNATIHELRAPVKLLNEINRVLKPGGKYYLSDLRRDMNPVIRFLMKKSTKNKQLVSGLISSISASYTRKEAEDLLAISDLKEYKVSVNPFSIFIKGIKN